MTTQATNFTATINCDTFIIPNKAGRASSNIFGKRLASYNEQLAKDNGFNYDKDNDKLIELWTTGKESENFQAHGFKLEQEGTRYYFSGRDIEYLPEDIFKDKKEGDVVTVKARIKPDWKISAEGDDYDYNYPDPADDFQNYRKNREKAPEFMITFNMKLNQNSYRYRNFGPFERALEYVLF